MQDLTTAWRFLLGSPDNLRARYNVVGPDYFRTLGVRVLAGREFDRGDRRDGEPVAIVNESLTARVPDTAIGRTLQLANESRPRRIIGVVREIKYDGITESAQPFVYLPLAQAFRQDMFVHLRLRAS